MKTIVALILTFILGDVATSQVITITDLNTLHDNYVFQRSKLSAINRDRYQGIDGTPFLNEEFARGQVVINDTILVANVPLRYNIFTGRMEFVDAMGRVMEMDTQGRRVEFQLGDRLFRVTNYIEDGEEYNGILELLVDGNTRLYKKHRVVFREAVRAKGYQDPQPRKFEQKEALLLLATPGVTPTTVRRRVDLTSWFNRHAPDLSTVIEGLNFRIGNEQSMVSLVQHVNITRGEQ